MIRKQVRPFNPGKTKMERVIFSALAALAVLASPASAQSKPASAKAVPTVPAKNKGISREDYLKNADQEFKNIDSNGDGLVDDAEIEAAGQSVVQARLIAQNKALFERLDTDRNGMLSPAEFAVLAGRKMKIDARPMLKKFDTNNDGRISALEFKTGKVTKFNELDLDHNGTLSPDEIQASRKPAAPPK